MQVTDHASPTAPADRDKVVFHAEGLDKVYTMGEVEVHALRSIDLDLYRGEFVVLLGPSGSGKSPLLNILGALDVKTSVVVLEAIARVNRELGTTTVVITHNADIAEIADRVIRLSDGAIAGVACNAHKKAPQELVW